MSDLAVLVTSVTQLLALLPWPLVPLQPVNPSRGNGFAASIVGALMAIGLLAVVAKFATTKPKNKRGRRR